MTQLLAIASAVLFGVSDFAGGMATRSSSVWRVAAWSYLIGAPLLLLGVVVVGSTEVTVYDLLLGAAAGIFGLTGIVLMYSAFSTGSISIIAPVIGSLGAAIPVIWDLLIGGIIEPIQWVGIVLSLGAIALLTSQKGNGSSSGIPLLKTIGAAVAFASNFIMFSYTSPESGLWPMIASVMVSLPIAFLIATANGEASLPERRVLPLVIFTSLTGTGASIALLLALQRGPLGINSVLSSLYPAFTVLAALFVLRERPNIAQSIGIALTLIAAGMLAL